MLRIYKTEHIETLTITNMDDRLQNMKREVKIHGKQN